MLNLKPFKQFGPGDHIKDELKYYKWTLEEFSKKINYSEKKTQKILNNKISIDFEIANKLSGLFKQSPQFWLNLEKKYRELNYE